MKPSIHPTYYHNVKITCACGNVIVTGSTKKEMHVDTCSACHPFYTGKQKFLDMAGTLEKFQKRAKKTAAIKSSRKSKKTQS